MRVLFLIVNSLVLMQVLEKRRVSAAISQNLMMTVNNMIHFLVLFKKKKIKKIFHNMLFRNLQKKIRGNKEEIVKHLLCAIFLILKVLTKDKKANKKQKMIFQRNSTSK